LDQTRREKSVIAKGPDQNLTKYIDRYGKTDKGNFFPLFLWLRWIRMLRTKSGKVFFFLPEKKCIAKEDGFGVELEMVACKRHFTRANVVPSTAEA
jgi:hypothetical protein